MQALRCFFFIFLYLVEKIFDGNYSHIRTITVRTTSHTYYNCTYYSHIRTINCTYYSHIRTITVRTTVTYVQLHILNTRGYAILIS